MIAVAADGESELEEAIAIDYTGFTTILAGWD